MMNTSLIPCRYAVIRYYHNPIREEAVNVGILLERQDEGTILNAFGDATLARRLWRASFDLRVYRAFMEDIRERIAAQDRYQYPMFGGAVQPEVRRQESLLDYLRREYGGQYQVSEPRPLFAANVEDALEQLSETLVNQPQIDRETPVQSATSGKRIHQRLRRVFERSGLLHEASLQENVEVHGQRFGPILFDFGHVTDVATLFKGLWLGSHDRVRMLDQAGLLGLRIDDVRKTLPNVAAYIVIGFARDVANDEGIVDAQNLLAEQDVRTILIDEVEPLVEDLRPQLVGA